MSKQIILLVEDDADIRALIRFHLQNEGYTALEAADGATGLALAQQHLPALVLLDVMLPEMDGLSVCRALQQDARTVGIPIIMLTARGEEIDRIVGLELGADDYVVKPFSVRELLLRIKAQLRRSTPPRVPRAVSHAGMSVDSQAHKATVNGQEVALTATEFRLLEDLLQHAGLVRTREQLLDSVWGYQFEGYARTVDTHVRRLRVKLGACADTIETIRGVGYRCKE